MDKQSIQLARNAYLMDRFKNLKFSNILLDDAEHLMLYDDVINLLLKVRSDPLSTRYERGNGQ